jgi:hypothetical protein
MSRSIRRALWGAAAVCAVTVLAAACGDPNQDPERGYTKAPLERPGLVVRPERPSRVSELGEVNLPRGERLDLADTVPARAPAAPAPSAPATPAPAPAPAATPGG